MLNLYPWRETEKRNSAFLDPRWYAEGGKDSDLVGARGSQSQPCHANSEKIGTSVQKVSLVGDGIMCWGTMRPDIGGQTSLLGLHGADGGS